MSVRERLEDARILLENGRKQGAWIQVLIAAAATSRLRYPRPVKDREAFTKFIREVTPTIFEPHRGPMPGGVTIKMINRETGEHVDFDHILYTHLRCNLVHEAVLAAEVRLSESNFGGGGTKESPLSIPDFWVINLAKAVAEAPENAADCAGLFSTA